MAPSDSVSGTGGSGARARYPARRALLGVCAAIGAAAAAVGGWIAWPLPPELVAPEPVPSLAILDRHGLALRETRSPQGSRGGWIPFAEVDPEILQAFLAAEDTRFHEHHGVDLRAVARAAWSNLRAGRVVSGASTITMQTARLLRPSIADGWTGKLAQTLWALRLEAHLGKQDILERYLNRVPLGQGAVGVAAAASLYFGAPASDVSLGQAALLAGLARAPSRDNPFVAPDRARAARDAVLDRLAAVGAAGAAEIARARAEVVASSYGAPAFLAPHFTTRLLLWAETRGTAKAAEQRADGGIDEELATADVGFAAPTVPRTRGSAAGTLGGTWRTTLDLVLQRRLESEVRHTVRVLRDRAAQHAAVVVLDNASGAILAWVGSPDFFADTAGQVDMVVSPRQPGSALKPFLYGLAFDYGFSAATVLPDVPRTFMTSAGAYRPQNYDRRFRGPVRIREALASSYNVPAVELTERVGTAALLATLRDAGFASLDRGADHYGLGLALGNGEVTLLELANAYRGLANGGVWTPVTWLLEDEDRARGSWHTSGPETATTSANDRAGEVADQGHGAAAAGAVHAPTLAVRDRAAASGWRRFVSPGAAALVLDVLSDPVARIPGFGVETPLDFPFPVAAKTGTSRHFTDNWAVATTGRFTVAVWVGNFSGRPMRAVSGISGAGPLLYRAVLATSRLYSPGRFPIPGTVGAVQHPVCLLSGLAATPECAAMVEWFLPGTEPTRTDDWEHDGRTVLPPEYAEWVALADGRADYLLRDGRVAGADAVGVDGAAPSPGADDGIAAGPASTVPAAATTVADATHAPSVSRILSPLPGDEYELPVGVDARYATIPLVATSDAGRDPVRWFVNGRPIVTSRWQLTPGEHTITARWPSGRVDSVRITVR